MMRREALPRHTCERPHAFPPGPVRAPLSPLPYIAARRRYAHRSYRRVPARRADVPRDAHTEVSEVPRNAHRRPQEWARALIGVSPSVSLRAHTGGGFDGPPAPWKEPENTGPDGGRLGNARCVTVTGFDDSGEEP